MARLTVFDPPPIVKQLSAIVVFGLSLAILAVPGVGVTSQRAVLISVAVIFLATVVAIYFSWRRPKRWRLELIVPVLDFIGIGEFCYGTGFTQSPFVSLGLLPLLWIAANDGRRYAGFAGLGAGSAQLVPVFLAPVPVPADHVVRAVIATIVFLMAAGVVNALTRQAREQLRSVEELADQRQELLEASADRTLELAMSEQSLRAAERLLRGVWEAVTEQAVIGCDVTGLIDAWNPGAKRLLGVSAEDAEDKLHIDVFHLPEELQDRARELGYPHGATVLNPGFSALVESARMGIADVREWTYVRADGSHLPVNLSVTPRLDESGHTVGYLFVANDMTNAHEVSRLKDEFVGLISHELRTPLSSILGYLELMRDDEDNPLSGEQLQYLGVAERNAHRLLRLVGDLLFTAQVESGKFPLDLQPVDMNAIVSAAVDTARPASTTAGVTLTGELPDQAPMVYGDPVRLGQACDNLISNAIKFTPKGGSVTIQLEVQDSAALVTVRDTGIGIAASELDQLFGRFFRATTATRNAVPGVGLGLTITKAIVTAHKGEMSVTSEEGVGTCFNLKLDILPSDANGAALVGVHRSA